MVGDGIYQKEGLLENEWSITTPAITNIYTTAVRGNAWNDVFVVGHFGEVVHYNGMSWRSYRGVTGLTSGVLNSVAVKGNIVAAVGFTSTNAIVLTGRRY